MRQRHLALFVFDDVEVLDFAGPFEVFSVTQWQSEIKPFKVSLVAEKPGPVLARNGLSINPHFGLYNHLPADIILVPGGLGTRREMLNPVVLDWLRKQAQTAELVLSVCTGSLVLGAAGLLDGLAATTHYLRFDLLRQTAPRCQVHEHQRVVDTGKIVTSGGIAVGLDMSFHVVARLLGKDVAVETAKYMEYHWSG
ncbi:MAG TPA: DJ-1/PfpI family protein [Gemmatales bacterium]|nr:DJ-1/PfpI family protein [Gemmatales bacterium]